MNFPERNRIWASPMRRNFTEIMNDIMFSGGSNESGIFSPFGALLTVFITSVTYFYWSSKCRIQFFFLVTNINLRNILAIFIYIEPSHKTLLYFSPVRALDNKTFTYITVFFISPLTIEVPIGINKPIVRETSPDWVMWMWMCGPGSIVSYCEQLGV